MTRYIKITRVARVVKEINVYKRKEKVDLKTEKEIDRMNREWHENI